ncbi:MAG: VCBS repeat-containing protein [Acidobacteria bacterium]|jgi:hypothetical protein|nr:VCBS repeat-containing protein [Acidobacteriota bacterium]
MTNHLRKAALCVLMLTGLPALAQAQIPNTCDFDGDGKTDPVVVRNVGGQLNWWILKSAGGVQFTSWGIIGDTSLCGDYDLDGKSDVTVWRSGAAGAAGFWVLRSSNGTAFFEPFGQTGDDAEVVGDYNGDGRDDFAVYRAGAISGDQSFLYYRTTQGGSVAYVPWGLNGDFSAPFDYDGDGKHDPMVQRNGGGGQAAIWVRQSSNGATTLFRFGTPTDALVPGNYDADATEDLTVGRGSAGQIQWWTRATSNGAISLSIFGASATDFLTQGDWDGDGKTDVAIWRPGQFWLNRSTAGLAVVSWGTNGDYPVNSWRTK